MDRKYRIGIDVRDSLFFIIGGFRRSIIGLLVVSTGPTGIAFVLVFNRVLSNAFLIPPARGASLSTGGGGAGASTGVSGSLNWM